MVTLWLVTPCSCEAQQNPHPNKFYKDQTYNFSITVFPEYEPTSPPVIQGSTSLRTLHSRHDDSKISIILHSDQQYLLAARYSYWLGNLVVRNLAEQRKILQKERLTLPLEGFRYEFHPKKQENKRTQLYQYFAPDRGRLVELMFVYPEVNHDTMLPRIQAMAASAQFGASPFPVHPIPDLPVGRILLVCLVQLLLGLSIQIGSIYAVARLILRQASVKNAIKYVLCVFSMISLITTIALIIPLLLLKGVFSQELATSIGIPVAVLLSICGGVLPVYFFKRLYHVSWLKAIGSLILHAIIVVCLSAAAGLAVGLATGTVSQGLLPPFRSWPPAPNSSPASDETSDMFGSNIKNAITELVTGTKSTKTHERQQRQSPSPSQTGLHLQGISWGSGQASAMINGFPLQEGDTINDYTIRVIERERVILSREGKADTILTVGGR